MSTQPLTAPPRSNRALQDRTYIVTGAGGGIGGAAVARLLRVGSNVVGVDLSSRRLAETEDKTNDLPGDAPDYAPGLAARQLFLRAATIYAGTNEIQRSIIAKQVFDM